MIYIVHGDNYPKSRTLIVNQQNKLGVETKQECDVLETSPQKLLEIVSSNDLFGNPPFVVLNISGAGRTNLEKHLDVVKKTPKDTTLIVLSSKTLPKTNIFIKNVHKLKAKVLTNEKIPEGNVFKFVDTLFYKNRKKTYSELDNLTKENADDFHILSMIFYGLRNVAGIIFDSPSNSKMKPFVRSKAISQSQNFSEESVKQLFLDLYDIDKKLKTGEVSPEISVTLAVEKVLNS